MDVCPGQAPIAVGLILPPSGKVVPSEENSASCGVLVDLFQSVTAISSVNYAFSVKITTQTPFKHKDGGKDSVPHHKIR